MGTTKMLRCCWAADPLSSLTSGLAATEKSEQEDEESPPENELIYPSALGGG